MKLGYRIFLAFTPFVLLLIWIFSEAPEALSTYDVFIVLALFAINTGFQFIHGVLIATAVYRAQDAKTEVCVK